ncbi:MAG: hypothetical protein ACU0CO_12920, partial [Shimia sp.]
MRDLVESRGGADVLTLDVRGLGEVRLPEGLRPYGADFARDGDDLVLTSEGGAALRLAGYLTNGQPLDLVDDDGGRLRGEWALRLAGPGPERYALLHDQSDTPEIVQDGLTSAAADDPIGQVEVVDGPATVQRADGTEE